MFQWDRRPEGLTREGYAVVSANFNIMNICLLVMWVMLAYIPFFHAAEILETGSGRALISFIVLFRLIRIFILQPVYAGFLSAEAIITVLVFLIGALCFIMPLARTAAFSKRKAGA
ncbi:MAG: hypothetical protein MUD12_09415 [Spirochaetes bacterium]|jgi:hypothetical protein|nr:hypothetical protein [Spirochaetota bacterium]